MESSIRIIVVDDHTLFREGLITLLNATPQMQVVGEAGTGADAVALSLEQNPDVIFYALGSDFVFDGPSKQAVG